MPFMRLMISRNGQRNSMTKGMASSTKPATRWPMKKLNILNTEATKICLMTITFSGISIRIRSGSLSSIRKRNARKRKLTWMPSRLILGLRRFIRPMSNCRILEMKARRMLIKANARPREARCSRSISSANHYHFAITVATTCGF